MNDEVKNWGFILAQLAIYSIKKVLNLIYDFHYLRKKYKYTKNEIVPILQQILDTIE